MKRKIIIKKILSILLTVLFLLTGWPGTIEYRIKNLEFRVGGEIQETKAITCGFGSEIGTSGVCRGLLTTSGSNQTWTSPADWNNSNNTIECIGAGGSGGAVLGDSTNVATGGGGGAYSLISNFTVATPGTTTVTYNIGSGGTAVNISSGTSAGNLGGDTWFNSSSFPGAGTNNTYCGAKGGGSGNVGVATQTGGTGGVDTSGWGETRRSGGAGGTASHTSNATGGGGAAGNSSTGGNGTNSSANNSATSGGQANGSGASGGTANTSGSGNNGGDGVEYTTEGSGGGGGGGRSNANSTIYGGDGGKRGGGGAGAINTRGTGVPRAESGAGYDGIIVITYTPVVEATFTQNHYRWYVDSDSENVTDPWSSTAGIDLSEDTILAPVPVAYDPPNATQELRLRVNITVNTATITANTKYFKLQFRTGTDSDCSTGSWTDVDVKTTGSAAWRYAESSVPDDTTLTVAKLTGTDRLETYSNAKPANTPTATSATGEDIEFDFHIVGAGSTEATRYLFRVVETTSDGSGTTALTAWTNCPVLHTEPGISNLMRHGEFFSGETEQGFWWVD